jgi:hypothetical protein
MRGPWFCSIKYPGPNQIVHQRVRREWKRPTPRGNAEAGMIGAAIVGFYVLPSDFSIGCFLFLSFQDYLTFRLGELEN